MCYKNINLENLLLRALRNHLGILCEKGVLHWLRVNKCSSLATEGKK